MGEIQDRLAGHLQKLDGPFLFVGAGLSRRYASLPNWEGLLRHFASFTDNTFEYYRGAADNDNARIASLIAEDFYDVWWKDAQFESSRQAYAPLVQDKASPLKIEVAAYIKQNSDAGVVPKSLKGEWEALSSATVDGIITTNFDPLLEQAFPEFNVFVGQDELLFATTQGIAEIYKIHGSVASPETLVLTHEDYEAFHARNPYLAAKLLTIFVEHPVLFIGYSLTDQNIQAILQNLVRGLQSNNINKLQQRLIFVEWDETSPGSIADTVLPIGDVTLPITRIVVPDFLEVFKALGARKRAIPAKVVRLLKQQVYEIVLSNDPKERLVAFTDIDSDSAKDVEIIFGIGAKVATVGIRGLNRRDIWQDVLGHPDRKLPASQVLDEFYDRMQPGWWVPVFKYLDAAGRLDERGRLIDTAGLKPEVVTRVERAVQRIEETLAAVDPKPTERKSMTDLRNEYGDDLRLLTNAFRFPAYTEDLDGLHDFLVYALDEMKLTQPQATHLGKAVVVYDYLRWGPGRALF